MITTEVYTDPIREFPSRELLRRDPTVSTSTPPQLIVYSDEGGFVTVTPMQPNYNLGETVTLTATPLTDSVFAGWVGDLNTSDNPVALTMDGNKTMRARFVSALPRLIAYSGAGGTITVSPMKLSYALGETVTLTATPSSSVFAGWTGDLNSTSNPATLIMDGNKTVRARFMPLPTGLIAPLPLGLIACWRGETDASDLIGGHHGAFFAGTVVTAPSVTASGKVGGAFNLDGTVHVRVPDSPALKPAQLTVEAWVFPTAPQVGLGTIIARGSSTNDFDTWYLGLSSFRNPEFISHDNHLLQGLAIPPNEWSHLAITSDGIKERLYVNGVQVAARDERNALVYDAVPVTIGSDWANNVSSDRFNGRIDEIALYNRALTADEILSIWSADVAGKDFSQPYFTSPAQLPDGVLGANYAQQIVAILGTGPVSFSLSAGGLPPGMTLSSAGLVSGVPGASGTFGFTARATDAAGVFIEQLCVLQVFTSVTAPAGLVGWWRAENDAQDSAGTNHGVLRNGAGFAAGRVGQAFALDGTDDCVEIPDAPALRPDSVTLEAWVAFDVTSGRQFLLTKARSPGPDSGSYGLWLEFGTLKGAARDGALSAPFSPVPGLWHHLAYTRDDVAKQQVLYIDGIQVAGGLAGRPLLTTPSHCFSAAVKLSATPRSLSFTAASTKPQSTTAR
jgi:hypothetical protein